MAEAHESADSKVISNAARRGELTGDLGGKLADAANNKSGDKPGMVFADEEDMGSKSKTGRSPVPRVSRNKVAGDQVRRCLPVLGMLAASTATTALAASTLTPVAGFALFVLLLGGLSLVNLVVVGSGGASGHGCQWDDDDGDVSLA